jgi:hypothetical protein
MGVRNGKTQQWSSEKKLSKYLTQTFMSHGNEMMCQPVTLSG